jgi:iron complex outermembrane receptor protein
LPPSMFQTDLSKIALKCLMAWSLPFCAQAAGTSPASISLADLSIEELARLPVTSVSRRPAPLATAAGSIYVITGEDIRRAGSTSLPEALRLAPNLQVARVNARSYAITARGFNNTLANKLLVMIDGRTVYSPLFSGVFWDAQEVVLEDIDRIEVVSGPGSTLWGLNAVNGVINITTKSTDATHGALLAVGGSMEERQLVSRYGGQFGSNGHFRVYAKHHHQDDMRTAGRLSDNSGMHRTTVGMRTDWLEEDRQVTVQGEALSGRLQQSRGREAELTGAYVSVGFKQRLEGDSEVSAQAYLDHQQRYQPDFIEDRLNTFDFDLQHSVRLGRRHNLVWGGGYRHAQDESAGSTAVEFLPEHKAMNWTNLFAQNDIDLFDAVHLTIGAKFARNPYTGWESLPNLRLSYAPRRANYLLWGALSRSVRSPSRFDREFFVYALDQEGGRGEHIHSGEADFTAEIARVAEFGYRAQPRRDLSFSTTLFFNHYDRLRTLEPDAEGTTRFLNLAEADVYGVEFWGGWQVSDHWRLSAGLVAQKLDMDLLPQSLDTLGATNAARRDPEVYWQLRSSLALTDSLEVEAFFRRVGELGGGTFATPGYSSLDLRCGWRLSPSVELSAVGQNLLDSSHPEFGAAPTYTEFRRALYVKMLWEL